MAPLKNSNSTIDATSQKPAVLGPETKARRVLPKHSHAQRSSLRKAIQESLLDPSAVAASTAPPPDLAPQSSHTPQRSSLRQAIKQSLQDTTATAALTTSLASPSLTLTSPSKLTSGTDSAQSIPSTPAATSQTPATPPSASSSLSELSNGSDYAPDGSEGGGHGPAAVTNVGTNGALPSRKGWYRVRSIIAESRNQKGALIYLVDWEGLDPRTGVAWPSSWVNANNVSAAAIREWKASQDPEDGA
ncbi:hypothetical protein M434DRAFT_18524 [Hypoxylon sp. CO27-5]|nr:hypothetical protein M434DRAFT_18524 [Hypoxylon sp. CO27-5]